MVTPDAAYDQSSDMNVPELLIRESVIWLYPCELTELKLITLHKALIIVGIEIHKSFSDNELN